MKTNIIALLIVVGLLVIVAGMMVCSYKAGYDAGRYDYQYQPDTRINYTPGSTI